MAIKISGLDDISGRLSAAISRLPGLTEEGVKEVTVDIGAGAALRAPIDTGDLRASMTATVESTENGAVGRVKFSQKYAAYQHEHVELNHPKGGEAKYLEKEAREKHDQISATVADAYANLFEGV